MRLFSLRMNNKKNIQIQSYKIESMKTLIDERYAVSSLILYLIQSKSSEGLLNKSVLQINTQLTELK